MKMKQLVSLSMVTIGVMLGSVNPSDAHHSRAMFDMTQNIAYQGVVKEYRWQNPHTHRHHRWT